MWNFICPSWNELPDNEHVRNLIKKYNVVKDSFRGGLDHFLFMVGINEKCELDDLQYILDLGANINGNSWDETLFTMTLDNNLTVAKFCIKNGAHIYNEYGHIYNEYSSIGIRTYIDIYGVKRPYYHMLRRMHDKCEKDLYKNYNSLEMKQLLTGLDEYPFGKEMFTKHHDFRVSKSLYLTCILPKHLAWYITCFCQNSLR
jgi:hypothetical protein